MLIKNASVLLGKELDFVLQTNIRIQDQRFKQIQSNARTNPKEEYIDCEGLLMIPGFVNCHTHIGDSIAKDVTLNSSVDKRIHPIDRTQIVTRDSLNELKIAEFERWSGSLRENINMILVENISILLASDRILSYPWDPAVKIDYWITVNGIRLEGILGDHVSLKAQWSISSGKEDKETVIRTI